MSPSAAALRTPILAPAGSPLRAAPLLASSLKERRRREILKYNAEYYDRHYWCEDRGTSNKQGARVYNDPDHAARFRFLANLIRATGSYVSVLDAGCGTGGFFAALEPDPGNALAFDVSEEAVRRASTRGPWPISIASVHEIPLEAASFDLVFCSDVLEHVLPEDAEAAVRELTRVTGRMLIATINLDNPYEYHPTIWSRQRWTDLFLRFGLSEMTEVQLRLQAKANTHYPEYSFFCFSRPVQTSTGNRVGSTIFRPGHYEAT